MANVPTQVRIDEDLKKQAVEVPKYKKEVIEAMEEAKRISKDPSVKGCTDLNEMFEELDKWYIKLNGLVDLKRGIN